MADGAPTRTTLRERVLLPAAAVIATLVALEIVLRVVGFALGAGQARRNASAAREGELKVLALGESTTQNPPHPWPEQLEWILREDCGDERVRVINRGRGGTVTALILSRLEDDLERFRPSIVVAMMGINDTNFGVRLRHRDTPRGWLVEQAHELRLWKLARWLRRGLEERRRAARASRRLPPATHSEEHLAAWRIAHGPDPEAAIAELRELAARYPEDPAFLGVLAHTLNGVERWEESIEAAESALALDPRDRAFYLDVLATATYRSGDHERGLELFREVLRLDPDAEATYVSLGQLLAEDLTRDEVSRVLGSLGHDVSVDVAPNGDPYSFDTEVVGEHYRMLRAKLAERGIPLVAMQYPTRPVALLHEMLGDAPDVVFVANEENFRRALAVRDFDDLFIDDFAQSFGHATALGNRLIAESAAHGLVAAGLVRCSDPRYRDDAASPVGSSP